MGLPTHICNSKEGYVMVLFMCGFLNFDTELSMQCMQYTYTPDEQTLYVLSFWPYCAYFLFSHSDLLIAEI